MIIRELRLSDLPDLRKTLENLRSVGDISDARMAEIYAEIIGNPNHFIFVAECKGMVVGTITLLVEQKFIRKGGRVGHIEDVAVRDGFGGNGFGIALVDYAYNKAAEAGCYKVILDCDDTKVSFYERCGFKRHEIEMRRDIP